MLRPAIFRQTHDATPFGGRKGRSNSNHTTRVPVDLQMLFRENEFTENVYVATAEIHTRPYRMIPLAICRLTE